MKQILFLIHDLGQGGAEKVLVNLVNNMDRSKFNISVLALFGGGVNEQFLKQDIHFRTVFPCAIQGNSKLMKLLTPKQLYKLCVREKYDIVVSYLEGPSARVVSGCPYSETKLVAWIHIDQPTPKVAAASFRSITEARKCYSKFDKIVSVSQRVEEIFCNTLKLENAHQVLYNTNESERIILLSEEMVDDIDFSTDQIKLVGVGKLLKNKGFDRTLKILKRLKDEQQSVYLYILGEGPERENLQQYISENNLESNVTLLGYQLNPYKYVAKCDLFVCASYAEGFSTAATEALIVGTPVCTVEVSGMKEMLGENNEYGVVVDNNDEALYQGIKDLIENPERLAHYKHQAQIRGKDFSTEETVKAVEQMFLQLCEVDRI